LSGRLIGANDELIGANDERAPRGHLMSIRGPASAGYETPAAKGFIWMVGDDDAFEPARR
jgi:hypothetical protein